MRKFNDFSAHGKSYDRYRKLAALSFVGMYGLPYLYLKSMYVDGERKGMARYMMIMGHIQSLAGIYLLISGINALINYDAVTSFTPFAVALHSTLFGAENISELASVNLTVNIIGVLFFLVLFPTYMYYRHMKLWDKLNDGEGGRKVRPVNYST